LQAGFQEIFKTEDKSGKEFEVLFLSPDIPIKNPISGFYLLRETIIRQNIFS